MRWFQLPQYDRPRNRMEGKEASVGERHYSVRYVCSNCSYPKMVSFNVGTPASERPFTCERCECLTMRRA